MNVMQKEKESKACGSENLIFTFERENILPKTRPHRRLHWKHFSMNRKLARSIQRR
jgi:hypothetical protein